MTAAGSKEEGEVAEGLIGFLAFGDAPEMIVGHFLGFLEFVGEDEVADPREVLESFGIVVVVWPAGPERGLVEGDAFFGDAAEDHGTDHAVAEGGGLEPGGGGLAVPEGHVLRHRHIRGRHSH